MKNKLILSVILLLGLYALSRCRSMAINMIAFHPDKKTTIDSDNLPQGMKEIFITTEDGIRLQCYHLPNHNSEQIVVFFHGNAGNLSHRIDDLVKISRCNVSVLGVSYRGYGKSEGRPSEKGIYRDGRAALAFSLNELGHSENKVYVFGRSLGTTVAADISQNADLAGLILVTPLTSGKAQARSTGLGAVAFLAGSSFRNIDKMQNIKCPVLVIHGTEDQVVPYEMGVEIHNMLKTKKKMIMITNAGHNNISSDFPRKYWKPISEFITGGI